MEKESVTEPGSQPAKEPAKVEEKDHRGVSWENVAKEHQRKLEEANRRLAELENGRKPAPDPEEGFKKNQEAVLEFVQDPDGFLERRFQDRKAKEELPSAIQWLESQEGFKPEDKTTVAEIIQEYGLGAKSPMKRAEAAWDILSKRKEREAKKEQARVQGVQKTMPEGSGRTTPVQTTPKRADLLKELAAAERSGNRSRAAEIISALEDVRG